MAPINKGDTFTKEIHLLCRMKNVSVRGLLFACFQTCKGRLWVGFALWSDADGHLRVLKGLLPNARLTVIFDPID